jgi:1-acyl-sn-glycerol-3-phosphate acyltransferase
MLVVFFSTTIRAFVAIGVGVFKKYTHFAYRNAFWPWARSIVWASGIKIKVSALDKLDTSRSYVIVSNHQSYMDIPVLVASLPLKLTIIAKKELFKIPVFAQGMRAFGILEIDRSNRSRAVETLNLAAQIIRKEKISVLAFPEGTRSKDGALQPFKKGPFALALNYQIPILPVTVYGTFPILPKGKLMVQPGDVYVIVHPPVETSRFGGDHRAELIEKVHHIIASGLKENEPHVQKLNDH